jgi:hypothetical protein
MSNDATACECDRLRAEIQHLKDVDEARARIGVDDYLEIKRLRWLLHRAHEYIALSAPPAQVQERHPALFARIADIASGESDLPAEMEAAAGVLLRDVDAELAAPAGRGTRYAEERDHG